MIHVDPQLIAIFLGGLLFTIFILLRLLPSKNPAEAREDLPYHCFKVMDALKQKRSVPNELHNGGAFIQWKSKDKVIAKKLSLNGPLNDIILSSLSSVPLETSEDLVCEVSLSDFKPANIALKNFSPGKDGIRAQYKSSSTVKNTVIFPKETASLTIESAPSTIQQRLGIPESEWKKESVKITYFRLTEPVARSYSQFKKWNEGGFGTKHVVFILLVLFALLVLFLRVNADSYDVRFEDFATNYGVLGLPPMASFAEVKKAWRTLGLKYHPDKNPSCAECQEKYVQISNAYGQISDYEKGKLKIIDDIKPKK
jgi:hypothetical protein